MLAMSDQLALGVLHEAASRGIAVPDDVSVVGFDDIPRAAVSQPPLTTVRQPLSEMAECAALALIGGFGIDLAPPGVETISAEIQIRGVEHQVLNAVHHKAEADIVEKAGLGLQLGALGVGVEALGEVKAGSISELAIGLPPHSKSQRLSALELLRSSIFVL